MEPVKGWKIWSKNVCPRTVKTTLMLAEQKTKANASRAMPERRESESSCQQAAKVMLGLNLEKHYHQ